VLEPLVSIGGCVGAEEHATTIATNVAKAPAT